MKNLMFFLFMAGFSFYSNAQFTKKEVIGHWKVKKIIKKSPNPQLRGVMHGFKYATFSFLENGDFHLKTESKAPTFQMMLKMMENSKWKFDRAAQLINVGTEKDGYSIMGIHPLRKDSKLQFAMDESELIFEMESIP